MTESVMFSIHYHLILPHSSFMWRKTGGFVMQKLIGATPLSHLFLDIPPPKQQELTTTEVSPCAEFNIFVRLSKSREALMSARHFFCSSKK
jgi:hypothetical protein